MQGNCAQGTNEKFIRVCACRWAYRSWGHVSLAWNILLMAAAGLFVNGPYALITTAVSADLGNHSSLAGAFWPCSGMSTSPE